MNIRIDPQEVLRYSGGRTLAKDPLWRERAAEAIALTEKVMAPRYCYRFFPIAFKPEGVRVMGTTLLLSGQDIKAHLAGCQTCVLLAATVGTDIEGQIRRFSTMDVTKSLMLDACATAAIESLCDEVCREIENRLLENEGLTYRFSPGYGDLPLELQQEFLTVLNTGRQIGLVATENSLLIPRKSVTAIMGVKKGISMASGKCTTCANCATCIYQENEKTCKGASL